MGEVVGNAARRIHNGAVGRDQRCANIHTETASLNSISICPVAFDQQRNSSRLRKRMPTRSFFSIEEKTVVSA